jgi:signal transduction histidine kinase
MIKKITKKADLRQIKKRIAQKQQDYLDYAFTRAQDDILKIFLDLAQEYDSLENFYLICVGVPCLYNDIQTGLYLYNNDRRQLRLFADSITGLQTPPEKAPPYVHQSTETYRKGDTWFFPILKKYCAPADNIQQEDCLFTGLLAISSEQPISELDQLFFSKFANRIGYNLHNRLLAQQNIDHLKFINNLVLDIEHNVIIPNMYFRHLFNQLRKKIKDVETLEETILTMKSRLHMEGGQCQVVIDQVSNLHNDLINHHRELQKQHANLSLFLESLFRRDHFVQGHLVLRAKKCLVEKEIIAPQLEQYATRLRNRNIEIVLPDDMRDEEIPLMVDMGLLAQVYANLFSNAVKYTGESVGIDGSTKKKMAYGRHYLPDSFGPGQDGVKFNVFTTGPHLSRNEAKAVYRDGYRGQNSAAQPGTGHGLNFVKHVIEMHGGMVGYETTDEGNNFYFILPLPESDSSAEIKN